MPANVNTMNKMPYFVARSESEAGLIGSMKSTPKDWRQPVGCCEPLARSAHAETFFPNCPRAFDAREETLHPASNPPSRIVRLTGKNAPTNDGCAQSDCSATVFSFPNATKPSDSVPTSSMFN